MNKFILLSVLLLSAFLTARADPFTVTQENGEFWKVEEEEAANEGTRRFRMKMELNQNLHLLDTATTICFESDSEFNIEDGAAGFGMSFLCAIHNCHSNTHLHTLLFGSHYVDVDGGKWAGAGTDASHTNRGVVELNNGQHPDTVFVMNEELSYDVHLPVHADEVDLHYKCFTRYDGTYFEDNLLVDIYLGEDWTMHEITIPAHEHEEEVDGGNPPPA